MTEFVPFPKIARLNRLVIATEKLDGTNAQVFVEEDGTVRAGSRNRWLTPNLDNHSFAKWVAAHADELRELGPGAHFGEWYGSGIGRGYGLNEKRFALFNTSRWTESRPACCDVVPVLAQGLRIGEVAGEAIHRLYWNGSVMVPGFDKPEGIVLFHTASSQLFKVTLEGDESPKGLVV